MFGKVTDKVDEMQDNIQAYLQSTLEYYKLDLFKKLTKSTISVSRILLLGGVSFLAFTFLSFGFAFLIGEALGNNSYGFFIMGGFYVLVFIIVYIFSGKKLEKTVLKSASKIFFDQEN